MKILVLNGSPKGMRSVTYQTSRYMEAFIGSDDVTFEVFHVGARIRALEKDFSPIQTLLEEADVLIFSYPIYTFIAPYQLHRFIELMKEHQVDVAGKFATQITTSKRFFDTTAHRCIKENCLDMGLKYIEGLSSDMEALLEKKGQDEAKQFAQSLLFQVEHNLYCQEPKPITLPVTPYKRSIPDSAEAKANGNVVLVTNVDRTTQTNLSNMIDDFKATFPYQVEEVNIRDFKFQGGCLGCMQCSFNGNCVYRDGFEEMLRKTINTAQVILHAFEIENHYTHASFKCYDDRQFCNGHRTVNHGKCTGYLISGSLSTEANLRTIVEARSNVAGMYLAGIANDQGDTQKSIQDLSTSLLYAMEHKLVSTDNFYGIGGMKVFRDLIYTMQGIMSEDHRFYKKNGLYDFPQKKRKKIMQMKFLGAMLAVPSVRKKIVGEMNKYILTPYEKLIDQVKKD